MDFISALKALGSALKVFPIKYGNSGILYLLKGPEFSIRVGLMVVNYA